MEEVRRVTTTKKSNKLFSILLIIAGVLGLALILAAIYFYMIKPKTSPTNELTEKICACYFIDPDYAKECGDPRKGFMFKQVKTQGNTSCQSSCLTSELPITQLNTQTKQEDFLTCSLPNIQDIRCSEMTVKNKEEKIITTNISQDDEIIIEAKFDKKYSNPKFKINNKVEEPDNISDDGLIITKTISSFSTTSIDIVATAEGETGEEINSPLCKRLLEVKQEGQAGLMSLLLSKRKAETTTKLSEAIIRIANIKDTDGVKIKFSFDKEDFTSIEMVKGFSYDTDKGEISIIEQDLYNTENFTENTSFSQLDGYVGPLSIAAEITKDGTVLGSVSNDINFDEIVKPEEPIKEEPVEPEEPLQSNFSITANTNIECVERVTPNDSVIFTANITNNATNSQKILSIKNKLPLGFLYTSETSKINNVTVSDSSYLKTNNIGETVELIWSTPNGWSIGAGESLTLVFQATAGANALTGPNQNEIVIEPAQVPIDPATLRAQSIVEVKQTCTPVTEPEKTPETGIFDSIVVQIITGMIILTLGWYIYNKPFGQIMVKKLVESGAYKEAELASWRIFKPKKYFEEQTIKKIKKKD